MRVYDLPDAKGHFGPYGGVFVSETLISALEELKAAYARFKDDPAFVAEYEYELKHYVGRPSPVYHARRWSEHFGGAQVYLKREDLNHTGAHKINNVIGQALLARHLGKPRVIAETGAGQHGVATATIAARYGMECVVYMGSEDVKRQAQNVYRWNPVRRH
jgi:tryptophan synthase beta chain